MLVKAVAIVLAGSWILLLAVDTLEDFVFPGDSQIHAGKRSEFAGFGRAAKSVYNLVQHGSRRIVAEDVSQLMPKMPMVWMPYGLAIPQTRPRVPSVAINKLHSVLII